MIEPGIIIPFILGIPVIASAFFFVGFNIGKDNGISIGKNGGIVFCMEHQKECKISYDYLKLQENQK